MYVLYVLRARVAYSFSCSRGWIRLFRKVSLGQRIVIGNRLCYHAAMWMFSQAGFAMHGWRSGRWFVLVSLCGVGVFGCRPATFLAAAAISQGAQLGARTEASGPWTFHGLNPSVRPRIRPGSYATATRSVHFVDAANLGPHSYRFLWSECNGIAYTCRGGHIDVAHVRKAADWTGYLAAVTLRHIERNQTEFRFKLREPCVYSVALTFPPDWDRLDEHERERLARVVSRQLGQYCAYTALTWHEIITWFGYRPRPHVSEFPSAFSWEDTYSNLLGVHVAGAALEQESRPFSEAVTTFLDQQLEELGRQPAVVAKESAEALRGDWYSQGWFMTEVRKRNFDVGLDDGYVTPCLVPAVSACPSPEPQLLPVPTLDVLAESGFSARIEIAARGWEEKRILRALGAEARRPIDPETDFALLMSYIEQDAVRLEK